MTEKISIITSVCNNQKATDLMDFIESVKFNTKNPYELIIVDNGSNEDIKKYLRTLLNPDILIIENSSNFGLGISTDQASHCVTTRHLFRLDSDVVIFKKDWDDIMMGTVRDNENVGQVGTPINTGEVVESGISYNIVDMIMGCCQYIPMTTVDKIVSFLKENREKLIEKANNWMVLYKGDSEKLRVLNLIKKCFIVGEGYHDPNFYYGVDDFDYSLTVKYLGSLCASAIQVKIEHRNASMDPTWKDIRHKHVNDGFNYFRLKWEVILATLGDRNDVICKMLGKIFGNFDRDEVMKR